MIRALIVNDAPATSPERLRADRHLRLAFNDLADTPVEAIRDEYQLAESIANWRLERRQAREHT